MSVSNEAILAAYRQTGNVHKAAALVGVAHSTVHRRLQKLGVARNVKPWTQAEIALLKSEYHAHADAGRLDDLASRIGRCKTKMCRKAAQFGLTDQSRKRPHISASLGARMLRWHAENDHPRGFKGHSHSEQTKARIGENSREFWAGMNEDEKAAHTMSQMKAKVAKYGNMATARTKGSWKAGWREIGDKRIFARSRWEANFARYLEHCKQQCLIEEWEHEPETFWFEAIKRGVRSYLPDFRVTEMDGEITYYEVKGWMDARSKTTISRFRKYYPQHKLTVIAKPEYMELCSQMRRVIPDWEPG